MNKDRFDVVIIGGGVGGLTCACYLAIAGKRVAVFEKNTEVGGYCRSFTQKEIKFDACIHSLSSCRPAGTIGRTISELSLFEHMNLERSAVPNIVSLDGRKLMFYSDLHRTKNALFSFFKNEQKQIERFVDFITSSGQLAFIRYKNKTFQSFLNLFFDNILIKKIFAEIILISTGVSPERLSAFVGCSTLREYFFDAGYYPRGGVQEYPNAIALKIAEMGGEVFINRTVKEIIIKNKKVLGVKLLTGEKIYSDYVVSACDLTHTFSELMYSDNSNKEFISKLSNLEPSLSAFCLYLFVKEREENDDFNSTIYCLKGNDSVADTWKSIHDINNNCFLVSSPRYFNKEKKTDKSTPFLVLANTVYKDKVFWAKNRKIFSEMLVEKLKEYYPDICLSIDSLYSATPITLKNWTLNRSGAAYGWANTIEQVGNPILRNKASVEGLFFAGHWLMQAHGIISATYTGRRTALNILRNF